MKNQVKQGKFTPELRSLCKACKWVHEADSVAQTSFMGVELCPMHASAPMMYEALKALWEAREDGRAMYRSAQVDKLVLDALAQAEGGR